MGFSLWVVHDKRFDRFFRVNMTDIVRKIKNNGQNYWAFVCRFHINHWKPLSLPEDANERILAVVEKWLEEN